MNIYTFIYEYIYIYVYIYVYIYIHIGSEAPGLLLLKKTYHNQDFSSFGEVVRAFLKEAAVSKPPITGMAIDS
jgi:hypothetical protein